MATISNLQDFLAFMGAETMEQASQHVYEYTTCGGWCEAGAHGILVGTTVEGSDAELKTLLPYPFTDVDWETTWEVIEEWADIAWDEAHLEEE